MTRGNVETLCAGMNVDANIKSHTETLGHCTGMNVDALTIVVSAIVLHLFCL